ncbi:MAG: excalibur calcium-binding domain-containing protein [Acidimicrobiia bacterium]|nr:excalibur calcium-binding domain-containing protein [Acidimicrobiia bacterium]MBA3801456.1 excalibur calcium-binding domain-containing protein [Acidimicrobiia bacterium]
MEAGAEGGQARQAGPPLVRRRLRRRYAPKRSNALYYANSKSDRDKDGVACEQ